MTQINLESVDVDDVIRRIQATARGELPPDSVSVEELRAAIEAQRRSFSAAANPPATSATQPPTRKKAPKSGLIVPDLDF